MFELAVTLFELLDDFGAVDEFGVAGREFERVGIEKCLHFFDFNVYRGQSGRGVQKFGDGGFAVIEYLFPPFAVFIYGQIQLHAQAWHQFRTADIVMFA